MDKIRIKQSKTADTRTCDWSKVTKEQLLESSVQHIDDIRKGFWFFRELLELQAYRHDLSKITHIDEFFEDFRTGFEKKDWWEYHQRVERHHFHNEKHTPKDINLIDILDQIVDGVMAGMARSGEYRQEPMSRDLLDRAYKNTVALLLDHIEVEASDT